MQLCHVEEEVGAQGAVTSVHRRRSNGTTGDGLGMAVPNHLLGEPVLPDGGMLLLELARVFPHPRPESHDGGPETGVRNSSALWGISKFQDAGTMPQGSVTRD